jgi:hypothetical protein
MIGRNLPTCMRVIWIQISPFFVQSIQLLQLAWWPNGKALLSGGKDCGFESRLGRCNSGEWSLNIFWHFWTKVFFFLIFFFFGAICSVSGVSGRQASLGIATWTPRETILTICCAAAAPLFMVSNVPHNTANQRGEIPNLTIWFAAHVRLNMQRPTLAL